MNIPTSPASTGTPRPTVTPIMMGFLLSLWPAPLPSLPEEPVDPSSPVPNGFSGSEDGCTVNAFGRPVVLGSRFACGPNGIAVTTVFCVVAGNVGSWSPSLISVVSDSVVVYTVIVCSETGQFSKPADSHPTAVTATSVLRMVVSLLAISPRAVMVGEADVVVASVAATAHVPNVAVKMAVDVSSSGPRVRSPNATDAPAMAPTAN